MISRAAVTLLIMLLTATTAGAADITQNTAVVINSGNKAQYNNKSVAGNVPGTSQAGNIDTFISQGAIVVDGIELNLTIDGFNVDYSEQNSLLSGISLVNGAKLHLTVKGVNTLTAGYGGAGIAVPFGCSLEITAASTGTLNATGGRNYGGGAGIGARGDGSNSNIKSTRYLYPQGCGDITINGGTINAQGGTWYYYYVANGGAAGIGSSECSGCTASDITFCDNTYVNNITGTITINGGTVHATGGCCAAGIGGGSTGTVKSITINGGNVTATAGEDAAAIGSGFGSTQMEEGKLTCADISITGGSVTANGNIGYGEAWLAGTNVGGSVTIGDAVTLSCTGTISPSTQHFTRRTFRITVYDASLTATANDVLVQLPGGKTAYCDLQVEKPGIGTATLDVLYADSQLGGSGTLTVRGFTSETLSLSESSHDVVLGGYCYTFSGAIYAKDIAPGTTATMTLDGVSDLFANATYNPETAGTGTTAGVARFSGYFITPTELSGQQTFRVTDSYSKVYTKAVTFPAAEAHKSNLSFLISDGSGLSGVTYIDENQTEQTCTAFQMLGDGTTWDTVGTSPWLVCNSDITIGERITVNGTVNLILCDGATLTANQGITVGSGNTLNIYGQKGDLGKLIADARNSSGGWYTGIGGMRVSNIIQSCGNISIYGGDVTAYGGEQSAGIGGCYKDYFGSITIAGGIVKAKGGNYIDSYYAAAGIGGGCNSSGGSITISGGTIHAESGDDKYTFYGAAGIGGGCGGDAGTIVITGGNITAIGKGGGKGIGPGDEKSGGTVSLSWTRPTDAIYANSYGGTVTLSSNFMLQGTDTEATTDNIGDKTIVPACTIAFDANGGSGEMNNVAMAVGATYQLPACTFTAPDEGKVFYRWQIGTTEYEPGASITVSGNLSVTALWREGNRTVTFNMNGHGTDIEAQTVPYGSPATAPDPAPTAEGYEFAGWYYAPDGSAVETPYDFNTPVTANIELTAHWSKIVDAPTLTVTGSYTYRGEQIIPTVTVKDGVTVVDESEYTVTTTNTTKAGTATVTITDKAGGDYKLGSKSAEFTVLPKPVTVSGITAKNKVADGNTEATLNMAEATLTEKVEGDVLTVSATGAFANAEAGEGKTVSISGLTLGGRDAANYVLAAKGQQTTATATIYAPHTVKFADETGTVLGGFAVETVLNGAKATDPTTDANRPAKDGYRFMGWNYNGEPFDFNTPLNFETTTTLTLTARFLKLHNIASELYSSGGDGTVAFDKSVAVVGEEVTVTASPDTGSELAYLDIFYKENDEDTAIPFTMTGVKTAKFTMPDKDNVRVGAAFTLSNNLLAELKNANTGNYEVTKAADLVLISSWMAAGNQMSGETILLMNDIDVSGSGFTSFPYTIQGSNSPFKFMGTFDGGGHTISGISISTSGDAGLFGSLGGTVKDLTVTGSVSGAGKDSSVGGIAQAVQSTGTIQDCVSLVKVTSGNTTYTGGIAGVNSGTISGCHYLGNGVPGAVGTYSYNVAATNCTALYAVTGSDEETNGITTVGTTTSDGTIYGDRYHQAGSQVTMELTAGGKDGWTLSGFKYQNNSNDDVNLTANGNGTYTLTVPSEDVTILPNYRYSTLTMRQDDQNRYLVTSVADLNEVASVTSVLDGCRDMTFVLANDIEFGENDSFGGIAVDGDYDHSFAGTFDGGGHTISGMNITGRAKNLGFIGYLTGTLQNLTLEYCTVRNTSDASGTYAGMLVGDNNYGKMYGNRVIGGTVSGANAGAIGGNWSPMDASNNLYNDEVTVISGGETKAPGKCGTSDRDMSYSGDNAAVVGWRVIFLDESGQLAPAQLVANGVAATKPVVTPAPRAHFTFNNQWKRGGSSTEYTFNQVEDADKITSNTTLYAVWNEEAKYTVSYSGNGGSGNDVSEQVYASEVSAFRLPNCFYTAPEGYHFSTWRIGGTDYAPGAAVGFSDDITATAQWARNAFELADNADNSSVLAAYSGKVADVTLAGRTLFKDGKWNTLCLPFSIADINATAKDEDDNTYYTWPLHGATVKELVSSSFEDGTLTMNFTEDAVGGDLQSPSIEAGKPYIVKWTKPDGYDGHENEFDISNPEFTGVTISSSNAGRTATDYVDFIGTFSPVPLTINDKSVLFLGEANTLYWPNAANYNNGTPDDDTDDYYRFNAFRAYFHLKNGLAAGDPNAGVRAFKLNFGDGEASGITTTNFTNFTNEAGAWYDLQGRKIENRKSVNRQLPKGLYIHGGKKVVVK